MSRRKDMDVVRLNRVARQLREIALAAGQGDAETPVSAGDLAVIEAVSRYPDSTITDLGRATGLAQSWVSTIVRDLAVQGVFTIGKDPKDRRQTRVWIDPAIRPLLTDHGSRPVGDAVAAAAPQLDTAGVDRVLVLLDELARLLVDQPAEVAAPQPEVVLERPSTQG